MLQRLSLPHAPGPQTPASPHIIPTTVLCPSSLATPLPLLAFTGMQVKLCFFFLCFVSFLTSVAETSFPHLPRPQPPTSPPCLAPQAPQVLPPPLPAFAGTQVKISFFFFFFVSFLTNVTETLFTPHAGSSNPHLSTT